MNIEVIQLGVLGAFLLAHAFAAGAQRKATEDVARSVESEIRRLREALETRLPLPLWGATPRPGPSGMAKPYQQFVNPVPVAFVKLNEAGDWVPDKK